MQWRNNEDVDGDGDRQTSATFNLEKKWAIFDDCDFQWSRAISLWNRATFDILHLVYSSFIFYLHLKTIWNGFFFWMEQEQIFCARDTSELMQKRLAQTKKKIHMRHIEHWSQRSKRKSVVNRGEKTQNFYRSTKRWRIFFFRCRLMLWIVWIVICLCEFLHCIYSRGCLQLYLLFSSLFTNIVFVPLSLFDFLACYCLAFDWNNRKSRTILAGYYAISNSSGKFFQIVFSLIGLSPIFEFTFYVP